MNKSLLIIAGVAALGGVAYLVLRRNNVMDAQAIAVGNTSQPSQLYPLQTTAVNGNTSRTDNRLQPWYGGPQPFQPSNQNLLGINIQDVSSLADLTKSVTSIWDDLDIGGWFSGGGDDFALNDFEASDISTGGFDWSSFNGGSTNYEGLA